jgi:hypothetical protein
MVTPKIERENEARNYGKFIIAPLERGFGDTSGMRFAGSFSLPLTVPRFLPCASPM